MSKLTPPSDVQDPWSPEVLAVPILSPKAILMVCLGNICRSPTAEAVMRHRLESTGLAAYVRVDSAGTHAGSTGSPPDERSIAHAARRGYDLRELRSRRLHDDDYRSYGLVLAMDDDNLHFMRQQCPPDRQDRVLSLMAFAPPGSSRAIPDPYYGRGEAFEAALHHIEAACDGLTRFLQSRQGELVPDHGR